MLLLFWRSTVTTGTAQIQVRARTTVIFGYDAQVAMWVRARTSVIGVGRLNGSVLLQIACRAQIVAERVELQYALPAADLADGGWTNELGSQTNLYASVDEGTPNDTDYIQSSPSPLPPDEVKLRLAPIRNPRVHTNHTLRYRFRKDLLGSDVIILVVRLYAADGSTVILTRVHSEIEGLQDWTLTLTPAQAAAIPDEDYDTGLVVGFSASVE